MPHDPELEDPIEDEIEESTARVDFINATTPTQDWTTYKVPEHLNDVLDEIPQCCPNPHVHVVSAAYGCCRLIGCKNCKAVWKNDFADGHDMDNHPPPVKLSHQEINQIRAKRRRRRKRQQE